MRQKKQEKELGLARMIRIKHAVLVIQVRCCSRTTTAARVALRVVQSQPLMACTCVGPATAAMREEQCSTWTCSA